MKFSVIVPFLNEELYIEHCIKSLLEQDFDACARELIFVDNGSTDRSPDIVRQYPEITLLREPLPNVYAARNKAIAIAKGEIIAFTDADCEVSPDWLSNIHRGIQETGADIVLGKRYFPPHSSVVAKILQDYENAKVEYLVAHAMTQFYFGFTNNMAAMARVFMEIGDFRVDISTSADTELVQRYVSKNPGSKIAYLPRAEIVHLEIVAAWTWMAKLYSYGQYNRYVENAENHYKELGLKERLEIFGFLIKTCNYSFPKSALAMLVLMACSLFYMAGQVQSFFIRLSRNKAYRK